MSSRPANDADSSAKKPRQRPARQPAVDPAAYHRFAYEQSLDAIVVADAEGQHIDVNAAALALFGFAREELLDLSLGDLLALSPAQLATIRAASTTDERWQGETTIATNDGRVIDAALRLAPIRTSARQLVATAAIVRDISAEKAAEAELAATHHHAREALERVSDGFYALDREWRFTYVNQAAEQIMARPREELLNAIAWDAYPPALATSIFNDLRAVLDGGVQAEFDYYYPPYARWFAVRAYPSERGLAIFFRDVTTPKQLEQELAAARQAARSASTVQSQFLAMISHELRTPLQAVLGYADLLLSGKSGSLTRAQREDIRAIRDGAGRMATLFEQVLVLARIGAGAIALSSEPVDLTLAVRQLQREHAPQATAKRLAFAVELAKKLPPALGDPLYVRQILAHLIGNAIKFTAQGTIQISAQASDGEIAVAVSDTGIGIAPEALSQIFDPFQQAENGPIRRYEGAGLGLAIARRLAEQMGGRITVSSELEAGSTFTLHLPIAHPPAPRTWHSRRLPGS